MDTERQPHAFTEEEFSVIRGAGLNPFSRADPWGCLWVVKDDSGRDYIVKSIPNVSYEMQALQKVRSLTSPRNITVPGHLYECAETHIFLMPFLARFAEFLGTHNMSWMDLLGYCDPIIDFVQLLHQNNIAYLDVSEQNLVWAKADFKHGGFDIPAGAIFYIDFGSTRVLSSGPGSGVRIHDFRFHGGKYMPPEGMDTVEPYAYDIFALGETFDTLTWCFRRANPNTHIPRCWTEWCLAMGDPIPERRPSIDGFRRQFSAMKSWLSRTAWMYRVLRPGFADALGSFGWRIISIFVH